MDQQSQKNDKLLNKIGKLNVEVTEKMAKRMAELMEEIDQKEKKNVRLKGENAKLEEKNRAMKRKMERMEAYIPEEKKIFICHPLPAELLDELFGLLPLENAFTLLAKMPNFVLARNVRKMLKKFKMAFKNNIWNFDDSGPKISISNRGLEVKHSGPYGLNYVRSVLPITKFNFNTLSFAYFEVEIVEKNHQRSFGVGIGFCTQKFPLEGKKSFKENLIRFWFKGGIWIEGAFIEFNPIHEDFFLGDVVGVGIVHSQANSPMLKCFATCNGKLNGMAELPAKFSNLKLYPAASLSFSGNSICANFGQEEWRFNPEQLIQQ